MRSFFVHIYNFWEKHKALYWISLVASILVLGFFASRITLIEDVARLVPRNENAEKVQQVLLQTKSMDRLVFTAYLADTSLQQPDSLTAAVADFELQLDSLVDPAFIRGRQIRADEQTQAQLMSFVQEHVPLFLNEQDYTWMEAHLSRDSIKARLENNYKLLTSPAGMVVKDIVAGDPLGISFVALKKLQALQISDNYEPYDGYLVSKDQKYLSFFIQPAFAANETGKNKKMLHQFDELIAKVKQQHSTVSIEYFGAPAVAAGNAAQMQQDTILTLSLTVVLLLALFFYFFRRKRVPVLILLPVVYGALFGMACVYWIQGSVSVVALGAGSLIMGIAVNYSLHFFTHFRQHPDIRETIRELTVPMTIGGFTTIAAFFGLRLVNAAILQDMGLFAGFSLIGAALSTLIFLPPLVVFRYKPSVLKTTLIDKIGDWQPYRNKLLVTSIFLLTPVMLYFSQRADFEEDLMQMNYMSPAMQQAQNRLNSLSAEALGAVYVVSEGKTLDEALAHAEQVMPQMQQMKADGAIQQISSPLLLMTSGAAQQKAIDRWKQFWTPERVSQTKALLQQEGKTLGFKPEAFDGFSNMTTGDYAIVNWTEETAVKPLFDGLIGRQGANTTVLNIVKVKQDQRAAVFNTLSEHKEVIVFDKQHTAQALVSLLKDDFNRILLFTSILVFVTLLIAYGRIELALMTFLPMIITWVWILGLMGMLGLKFNIVNIIISTLIFGLGDDYSIFIMDGLLEEYRTGKKKVNTIKTSVYLSAITTILGLGVLVLAKHPAMKSIAFISITGILCVLFVAQTVQPFLFNFFIANRTRKGFQPFTLWSFIKSVFSFLYFATGSVVLTLVGLVLARLVPAIIPPLKDKCKYLYHQLISAYTWSIIHVMVNVKKRTINPGQERFDKPAVLIANHSSFLDILITTMLSPKVILLTNKWVYKSPVFGGVVRLADYYPVADGAEDSIEELKGLVDKGYSVVVFPEGTRSYDDKIKRFHKGAFFIAERLKLDILPLVLHGVSYTMQKGDFLLKNGTCTMQYLPRIAPEDTRYGNGYSERAKLIGRYFRSEYAQLKKQNEQPKYFFEQLLRSYQYKGPVLEWYLRIKVKLDGYYQLFHEQMPETGNILDLGCGYGFMSYMLRWAAPGRTVTGVDYDEHKIETANGNFRKDGNIDFHCADVTTFALQRYDGIIISDVLHYLTPEKQNQLVDACINALNPGGKLLIRDGVTELKQRQKGTWLTELFSTQLVKFNKTSNALHFISRNWLEQKAAASGVKCTVIDNTAFTSNLIFVIQKPVNEIEPAT